MDNPKSIRNNKNLEQGASMFETTTKKVENKYYWENMKYRNWFYFDDSSVYQSITRKF